MSDQLIGIGVQTILLLLAGGGMLIRNDTSLKAFQKELTKMQQELSALSQVITKQAVQDERLNEQSRRMTLIETRIEQLRVGQGYIQNHTATTVDREY